MLSTTMPTGEGAAIRLVDLYREELVAGHPADGALQRGKLAYLEQSDDYEDKLPIHWAGWQNHGAGVSVEPYS